MKKSNKLFLGLAILWFVIAVSLSVVMWGHVLMAAKIGFFATGLACGLSAGRWIADRKNQTG